MNAQNLAGLLIVAYFPVVSIIFKISNRNEKDKYELRDNMSGILLVVAFTFIGIFLLFAKL